MNEESLEILNYLPIVFTNSSDREYISFLWNSFESNYVNKNYQFAYIAYHMLFMSFLYFKIWQLKVIKNFSFTYIGLTPDEEKALCGSSPFAFCRIKERSILKYFRLLNCSNSDIGKYQKLIDIRNDLVHSNGNIYFKDEYSVIDKIKQIVICIKEIEHFSNKIILFQLEKFLIEISDKFEIDSNDIKEYLCNIFLQSNYISVKDIVFCLNYNIENLSNKENFENIKELSKYFCENYKLQE